jgi:uncharacterized OsmC-like protein
MQRFPHRYVVTALVNDDSDVLLDTAGVPALTTRLPAEFDGPGDAWSPEALLVAAVADCYAFTFRGIARKSNLPWTALECRVSGTLDRVDNVTRFTKIHVHARVRVPAGTSPELAGRVLVRAEATCLVTRSLNARTYLTMVVDSMDGVAA